MYIYIHMVHIAQTHYYMSLLVLKYMLRKKMLYVHIYIYVCVYGVRCTCVCI